MRQLLVSAALIVGCAASDPTGEAPPPAAPTHGPKCTVELVGGPPVDCVSAGINQHGDRTVLTFNFCWRNDTYVCDPPPQVAIDGIFLLPGAEWREGDFREAGGFLDVQVAGGAHHRLDAPGGTIPIDLRVVRQPVTGGGTTLRGQLELSLPRVDRPGAPLAFRAAIN
jgi:hypothetical protein